MSPHPRRSRALRPLRVLLALIITGDILFLLSAPLNWIGGGRTPTEFWAPYDTLVNAVPDALRPAYTPQVDVVVAVTVADPSPGQLVLEDIAQGTVSAVVWLVVAVLAHRIVTSALQGDPFTVATADRMRRLSIVILAGVGSAELLRAAAAYALFRSVFPSSNFTGAATGFFSSWWLPLGFAVLAFAAVVRHGCALRTELDEVI